jgi:beta-galactosidase GanA
MKKKVIASVLVIIALFFNMPAQEGIPRLQKQGTATQLIVNNKPFLVLGGELGNSTASDLNYLKPYWDNFIRMNVNTILTPVYWELIEPEEGKFDFKLLDNLILDARKSNIKLVLLWFGAWKNSMSCYTPAWVKTDLKRFPRAVTRHGKGLEILSPFDSNNLEYDKKAFACLMKHIKDFDSSEQTIIMIQVENEIGMIPEVRDYSSKANELFNSPVPADLLNYIKANEETLVPEFKKYIESTGSKTSGTWEEVFGKSIYTEEIFMAWYYGVFVNELAAAGKAEYNLPMYVNAALNRDGYLPGQYPSAGPLPHLMDIWKASAKNIDFLSPDIYFPDFSRWTKLYDRGGNPLFIPEAEGSHQCASNAFYAFGEHDAFGFSPFSIESLDPDSHRLTRAYNVLKQLTPAILENQGKNKMAGILLDKDTPAQKVQLGDYIFNFSYELNDRYAAKTTDENPRAGGLIIQLSNNEYIVSGSGLIVTVEPADKELPIAGFLSIDEGRYENGKWVAGRRLNGDQNHQGRHMRLSYGSFDIQRVKLYNYK